MGSHELKKSDQNLNNTDGDSSETGRLTKTVKNIKVLSKRKTIKTKESIIRHVEQPKTRALKSKSETPVEPSVTRSTPKGETSKINDPVITKGKSNIAKSISQSPANGTSAGTSLKKKKIIDPITSLNASMKAKSQLRTNDGKFARSPLKTSKPLQKTKDSIEPSATPKILKKRGKPSSVSGRFLRSKIKAAQHVMKDAVITSRRNSRLSSDIMPTLEPEAESPAKEDTLEKSPADFPIPTPVASTSQPKGLRSSSRNSSLGRKSDVGKETTQNKVDLYSKVEVTEIEDNNKSEEGKGKRLKKIVKKAKEVNNDKEIKEAKKLIETKHDDISKELESSTAKEVRGRPRKSLTAKVSEKKDVNISLRRFSSSSISKNKEEENDNKESETVFAKGLKTRKTRSKQQRQGGSQIADLLLEGKRLSEPKEDLLKNLGLKSTTKKPKKNTKSLKSKIGSDDSESILEVGTKKEKSSAMRKSPRTAEKKNLSFDDKEPESEVSDKSTDLPDVNETSKLELIEDNKLDSEEQNADQDVNESNKKTNSLEATPSTSQNKTPTKRKKITETSEKETETLLEEEIPNEMETPDVKEDEIISKIPETTEMVNLNLETIQQESCNSNMDSGKENSLETSMNVAKLKVTRPKKSRNSRKERTSKRSLSNVIGILTEGINIPIEAQESVVLTLQTSIEIANPVNAFQNNGELQTENNVTREPSETASNLDSNVVQNSSEKPKIEESIQEPTSGSNANLDLPKVDETPSKDPPTNDIILDLARRKPKGKGSFLERIVSKIAKKKDVLLEGDAGFSLESTNADLRNDLNNFPDKCLENGEKNTDKVLKHFQSSISEKNNAEFSEIEGTKIESEIENQNLLLASLNESSSIEKDENKEENKSTRKSKKRSLEVSSPSKNKRKITTEVPEEDEVEKELSFGDIMSLVHKSAVPAEDIAEDQMIIEEKVIGETEEKTKEDNTITDQISFDNEASINESIEANTETSKRSKRKPKNENVQDQELNNSLLNIPNSDTEDVADSQKVTRKSSRKSFKKDKLEVIASTEEGLQLQNEASKYEELPLIIEGSHISLESKDRQIKNLAEEHLELSDDDSVLKPLSERIYQFSGESDDSESVESFKRPKNRSTKRIDKDSDSEMFKIPNAFGTNKRSSRRKSLISENFESTDDFSSEDTSASESSGLISEESGDKSSKRRFSRRRQIVNMPSESEDDMSTDSFSTTSQSSSKEESNFGKRQTPGRKAKQNISLLDEHIILPDDESLMQEDASLEEESFTANVEVSLKTSTEKKRPGRKPKKNLVDPIKQPKNNISLINEDLTSKDASGTDNEVKDTSGKSEEEKLCEGIQTQLKRSEHMFVSNMKKKSPGRKSKKNISLAEEHLLLDDDVPTQKEDGGEENMEKDSINDVKNVESSKIENESTQNVVTEKKRPGRKVKKNITLDDSLTQPDDVSMQKELQVEEEVETALEIQEPSILEIQSSSTEKKRPDRKSKKNILVDEVSISSQQKENIGKEKIEELMKSMEEPTIAEVDQSKSEKKRPGRKPKKNISLVEEHLPLFDDKIPEDSMMEQNLIQNPVELVAEEKVEIQEKSMEDITPGKSPEKKRPGRKSKNLSTQDFVKKVEEKAAEKVDETIVESTNLEIEINQTYSEKKRLGRKVRKNIFAEDSTPMDEPTNEEENLAEVNKIVAEEVNEKMDESVTLKNAEVSTKESESLENKRPGRKAKKNISLIDEHLNLSDDFLTQNDVYEEINLADKSLEEVSQRKRPGRKSKKNISESAGFLEDRTISKKPEEELVESSSELQTKLPEEPQTSEIEIRSSSLERKRPGRRSKKNISLIDEYVTAEDSEEKELSRKIGCEINDFSQKDSDPVSEFGSMAQLNDTQNIEKIEKKRSGKKFKKGISLLDEHLILLDSNTIENQESDEKLENKDHLQTCDIVAGQNESPEKRRPGRKSKKQASLFACHLSLSEKIPSQDSTKNEKIIEIEEKDKITVAEKESEAVISSISEVLVPNTSLERKRPGRKAKKNISLLDEHLDLEDQVYTPKEREDSVKENLVVEIIKEKISEESKTLVVNTIRSESSERKRKTLKRKSKNVSLLDEHLSLSDEDKTEQKEDTNIHTFSSNNNKKDEENYKPLNDVSSTLDNITSILENEVNEKSSLIDDNLDLGDPFKQQEFAKEDDIAKIAEDIILQENNSVKETSVQKIIETSLEPETNSELQSQEPSESKESLTDEFQTPKKRPAGNFAVVHTKSGEILIVEKKKKLTKEAAKFFCDICATSFTRKSSLKKHNLSQSHLMQINHTSGKESEKEDSLRSQENILDNNEKAEKIDEEVEEKIEDRLSNNENLKKSEGLPRESSAENLVVLNELVDQHFKEKESVPQDKSQISLTIPTQPPEESIEDELLDEEICKITENMTHDEYVLTDHISPGFPEAASTPIKNLEDNTEMNAIEASKKKNKKAKNKKKKKNLADEHLDLDTPEPNFDTSTESQTSLEDEFLEKSSSFITDISAVKEPISIASSDIQSELNIQKSEQQLEIEATISKEIYDPDESKPPNTTEGKRKTRKQNTEDQLIEPNTNIEHLYKRDSLRFNRNSEKKEEISRPKRNQLKQNYKEYEAFDFEQDDLDLEISVSKRVTSKSRKTATSNRESSRYKKIQEKEKENENNKEEDGSQNKIEKRTRGKSKKDEQNEEKEEIETSEALPASLTKILGTESEIDSTFKMPEGEKLQDSLLSNFADVKSTSKLEDPKAIFGDDENLKLDFMNVAKSLKVLGDKVKYNTNDSVNTEFDSDDNSLNTDMSVDIQKLLDDPELSIDNNSSQIASNNHKLLSKIVESGLIVNDILNFTETVEEISTLIGNDEIENIITDKTEDAIQKDIENKTKDKTASETSQMTKSLNVENKTVPEEVLEINVEKLSKTSKPEKGSSKGQKVKSKQKKGSSKNKATELIERELSDNDYIKETQNKNKIVRSVFGRVFGGEKIDKVKEVLEDWNSKSESSDSDLNKSQETELPSKPSRGASKQRKDAKKNMKRRSRNSSGSGSMSRGTLLKRKSGIDTQDYEDSLSSKRNSSSNSSKTQQDDQFKTNRVDTSLGTSELLITSSRCRQSKKRAEERISSISRAFDESPIPDDCLAHSKSQKDSKNKEASFEFKNPKYYENIQNSEEIAEANREVFLKRSRRRSEKNWEEIFTGNKIDTSKRTDDFVASLETDFKSNESLSHMLDRESVTSIESSRKSQSPLSQMSQNSEEEENEDDILRRRMSPFFDYNNSYTSLGSSTNSNNGESEDEPENNESVEEQKEIRRKSCSSEFSGEKIVIRSPLASHENRVEVVTIAPTDAIEDNALDVPQEIISATAAMSSTSQHKSRQGKVLNFDQELFVECCSRLKASTEKELRGAKKFKLDHSDTYRKDNPTQIFRSSRDRWKDVESQNSLGSLLESVNQVSY